MKIKPNIVIAVIFTAAIFPAVGQQTAKSTPGGIGYLQYLPDGYHSNPNRYPVVISLHGYKEKGTSSTDPKLVRRDLSRVANVGLPKYVKYGKKYPFILISPQLKNKYGMWPAEYVMEVINYVRKTLRIDDGRIYLTGLSLGGFGVWKTAGAYPDVFAAIGPICSGGNALEKAGAIAKADIAVWGFHGGSDPVVSQKVTTSMVNAINSAPHKPDPLAKVTIFPKMGHLVWDKVYNETGLLSWMLSVRKGSKDISSHANAEPVANAGPDLTITMPASSLLIQGRATDKDGKVVSYVWTKVSGGKADLRDTGKPHLNASGLAEGTYVFRLTVRDNDGATDSDDIRVTVKKSQSANIPPVVNAGPDVSLRLPNNSITLRGTATDKDGSVDTYQWTKVSGGRATLNASESKTLAVSGLEPGKYVFVLTVRDNHGATSSDNVLVNVVGSNPDRDRKVRMLPAEPDQRQRRYRPRRQPDEHRRTVRVDDLYLPANNRP